MSDNRERYAIYTAVDYLLGRLTDRADEWITHSPNSVTPLRNVIQEMYDFLFSFGERQVSLNEIHNLYLLANYKGKDKTHSILMHKAFPNM